jgi:hypothetical protein
VPRRPLVLVVKLEPVEYSQFAMLRPSPGTAASTQV